GKSVRFLRHTRTAFLFRCLGNVGSGFGSFYLLTWLGQLVDVAGHLAARPCRGRPVYQGSLLPAHYGNRRWSHHSAGLWGIGGSADAAPSLLDCGTVLPVYSLLCR